MLADWLLSHVPADSKEAEDLHRMRDFAARLEAPFSRAQPGAHFTASAVIVTPERDRVLLVHHAKLGRWLQPGGHAEEGDAGSLRATALREAREETSLEVRLLEEPPLDVDIHRIPARADEPEHLHLDVRFLMVAAQPQALAHDPAESHGAQWVLWEEALARADEPAFRRMLTKARQRAQAKEGPSEA